MLKLVGFFEELGSSRHYTKTIRDAVRSNPSPDENGIIEYLKAGHILLDVPETSVDAVTGRAQIVGAPSLLTDGVWLWRLDLAYYVERYHIELPREFVEHVVSRGFRVTPLTEQALEEVGLEALRFF